jgi:ketosteroid isomerase-like protein
MSEAINPASAPEEITRLFVERANAGDAEGMAALYEVDAVLAYPPGQGTNGRSAIKSVCERILAGGVRMQLEDALPTVQCGGLALTGTYRRDGVGIRVQVARQQADRSWLRVIDVPEPGFRPS